jgi:hypothetical protein
MPADAGCQGSFTLLHPKLSTGARIEIGIGAGLRNGVIAGIVMLLVTRHKVENAQTETLQTTLLRSSVKGSALIQRRRFASIGLIIQRKWLLWCTRTHSAVAQTGREESPPLSRRTSPRRPVISNINVSRPTFAIHVHSASIQSMVVRIHLMKRVLLRSKTVYRSEMLGGSIEQGSTRDRWYCAYNSFAPISSNGTTV